MNKTATLFDDMFYKFAVVCDDDKATFTKQLDLENMICFEFKESLWDTYKMSVSINGKRIFMTAATPAALEPMIKGFVGAGW